jgi:hypothetical protein
MQKELICRSVVLVLIMLGLMVGLIFLRYASITGFVVLEGSYDDFESGNLNKWTLTSVKNNWTASTTDPYAGNYHAQAQPQNTNEPASVMERAIDTSGYENIVVSYYRKLVGLDIADEFKAKWYDGSTWYILEETGDASANDADYVYKNYSLSSSADNNSNFMIKFECTAGAVSEYCRIDNFGVSGDEIILDANPPDISIIFPEEGGIYSYNETISLNYSVSDENLQVCWYNLNNGENITIPNCQNTTFNTSEGSHTIYLYANDSVGNENSSSINFTISLNSPPTINLVKPEEGDAYGYNTSISLNFSVYDADNNAESCWYSIDLANNLTIPNCQNTTFNTSEGSHTVYVYVNDSYGEEASSSANFSVQVGAPSITLHFPIDAYLSGIEIEFNYTPWDVDLDSCELWGDFSGNFSKNQTDVSPLSDVENNFTLNLSDGNYMWNIKCNDTQGNEAVSGNKSFVVDTINPDLTLTEPSGSKTSRTLTALWFVSDINLGSCWYNVYRGEN